MAEKTSNVGFVFSSKNRPDFSRKSLASIDQEGGFDLLWVDGSDKPEAIALLSTASLQRAHWVEKHGGVKGGPDAAIRFGLTRLLDLGYEYCGLIENDLILEPGWFKKMMELFELPKKDGFVVGATTVRNVESRVLSYFPDYTLNWNMGAGMTLFTREAAQAILADNDYNHSWDLYEFYKYQMGHDLRNVWELWQDAPNRNLGMDWRYARTLYQRGLVVAASIPNMTTHLDVDFEEAVQSRWVREPHANNGSGILSPAVFKRGTCPVCVQESTRLWSPFSWRLPNTQARFALAECDRCGGVFCTPRPTSEQLAQFYKRSYNYGWFEKHRSLKKIQGWHRWQRVKRLLQKQGIRRGRLLDVGCGHGLFARWAKRDGWDVVGVDFPSAATKYAREKEGLTVLEVEALDALSDDLGTFDLITIWHCLEHTSDPSELLMQLKKRLTPSGRLLIGVPNAACPGMRGKRENWVWTQEPFVHTMHFTPPGLAQLVERAGLRVASMWSRDTWDANRAFDLNYGDRIAGIANRFRRVHDRLGFIVEEFGRLACYAVGGFRHWALHRESDPESGSELLALTENPSQKG